MHGSECPHCVMLVPANSRYCPECGRALETGLLDAPLLERPAWALSPPDPVFLIGVLVVIGGLVLLIGGVWAWGVVALLAAAVLLLARGRLRAGTAGGALGDVRGRFAATRVAMAARSREQVEVFRARRELAELEAERNRLFRDLGAAVYRGDQTGMDQMHAAVSAVEDRIGHVEGEIEAMRRATVERVETAQAPVKPTVGMESPPEPARVPEPWPPPDEGDLPGPPTPAPGEPTPGPEEPAPPRHPPMPTGRSGARSSR